MPAQIDKQELLEAIQKNGPHKVVQQYRHNLLPSRVLIDLYSEHPDRDILLFLALYPTVPSQVLEDLADACHDPEIQAAAATNPRCTHLLLVRMAREGGAPVRAALAANKLQNTKITAELLRDRDLLVRSALAGNSAIHTNYRQALALDPDACVRSTLAGSGKIQPELLHVLSTDESAVVRAMVYGVSKAQDELLLGWAGSDDTEAQRLLLSRSKLPKETLQTLGQSPDPFVQEAVHGQCRRTSCELLASAESEDGRERLKTAKTENLPPEIQHILAVDPLAEVRTTLAVNPSIDEEVALCIAASNDLDGCLALAGNLGLPHSVKIELCHHDAEEVRIAMAYRDDLTDELLSILVNGDEFLSIIGHLAVRGIRFGGTGPDMLQRLLAHRRTSLHVFAAAAEQLTHAQVRKLMRDEAASVRMALCENPVLTRAAMEELTQDWNREVAEAAAARLEHMPNEEAQEQHCTEEGEDDSLVSRIVNFFK